MPEFSEEIELGGVGQPRRKALDELVERLDGSIERQAARLVAEHRAELDDWMREARRDRG